MQPIQMKKSPLSVSAVTHLAGGFAVNDAYTGGGAGAAVLALTVVAAFENQPPDTRVHYQDNDSVEDKSGRFAHNIYGAVIFFTINAKGKSPQDRRTRSGHYLSCIAKTQFSFSTDPKAYGVATDFEMNIHDLIVNNGAGMIVAIAGDILRMPGLPKKPQAMFMDINGGVITGLS